MSEELIAIANTIRHSLNINGVPTDALTDEQLILMINISSAAVFSVVTHNVSEIDVLAERIYRFWAMLEALKNYHESTRE